MIHYFLTNHCTPISPIQKKCRTILIALLKLTNKLLNFDFDHMLGLANGFCDQKSEWSESIIWGHAEDTILLWISVKNRMFHKMWLATCGISVCHAA